MNSSVVINVETKEQFSEIIRKNALSVIHFKTPWAPIVRSTEEVISDLSSSPEVKDVVFAAIDAEGFNGELSLQYNVSCVPTVLFFKANRVIDRIDGVYPAEIAKKVISHASVEGAIEPISMQNNTPSVRKEKLTDDDLKALVSRHDVMIFMKGNPDTPRCGFSRTLISIMQETGVAYDTFDILENEEVRQSLKTYSDWHTYPQVYVKGVLMGGLDVIKQMQESGELLQTLKGES